VAKLANGWQADWQAEGKMLTRVMDFYRGKPGWIGRVVRWLDVRWLRREVRRTLRSRQG
jgi:hypothetical protein